MLLLLRLIQRSLCYAHIKAEFNGYNHPELARKYGVTERWVRQLCGEGKLEGQMSLLDYGDEPENTTF